MIKEDSSSRELLTLVFKGFGVLTIAHFIPWFLLKPLLTAIFPSVPENLISKLSSSAISPVIASYYMFLKTRQMPKIMRKGETLYASIAGMVGVWLLTFIMSLIVGAIDLLNKELVENLSTINLAYLFLEMIWSPLVEETLFRGYFLEILRRWNNVGALLLSSILFTVPHLLTQNIVFGGVDGLLRGIDTFVVSIILGLVYMQGGLGASILVHAFANFYR